MNVKCFQREKVMSVHDEATVYEQNSSVVQKLKTWFSAAPLL